MPRACSCRLRSRAQLASGRRAPAPKPAARAARRRAPVRARAASSAGQPLRRPGGRRARRAPRAPPSRSRLGVRPARRDPYAGAGLGDAACVVGLVPAWSARRTIGTPASAAARIVALPPTVTSAEQRGSSSPWLSQRATCTFGGDAPSPSTAGVALLAGRDDQLDRLVRERRRLPLRSRNGSPYASVLSVTCTHGRSAGISRATARSPSPSGYQMQLPDVVDARRAGRGGRSRARGCSRPGTAAGVP